MTTLHDFGSVLGRPLDTSFGLSQCHGHGAWLIREVALRHPLSTTTLSYMHQVHVEEKESMSNQTMNSVIVKINNNTSKCCI